MQRLKWRIARVWIFRDPRGEENPDTFPFLFLWGRLASASIGTGNAWWRPGTRATQPKSHVRGVHWYGDLEATFGHFGPDQTLREVWPHTWWHGRRRWLQEPLLSPTCPSQQSLAFLVHRRAGSVLRKKTLPFSREGSGKTTHVGRSMVKCIFSAQNRHCRLLIGPWLSSFYEALTGDNILKTPQNHCFRPWKLLSGFNAQIRKIITDDQKVEQLVPK